MTSQRSADAPDRVLVDAVLAGDREAYRVLVEREARQVMAICLNVLRDADEAQDVAQDVFVQAYRSLAGYRGDGTFGAWIGRIASRMATTRARAASSGRQRGVRGSDSLELALAYAIDEGANPERHAMSRENASALRDAIKQLPADQREVVELRFYRDMQIEQIAELTHTPVGTVKSRLHRALGRLREQADLRSAS